MATHSSVLVWKTPWTEETGGIQFLGLQRRGHDLVTEHNNKASLVQVSQWEEALRRCLHCLVGE